MNSAELQAVILDADKQMSYVACASTEAADTKRAELTARKEFCAELIRQRKEGGEATDKSETGSMKKPRKKTIKATVQTRAVKTDTKMSFLVAFSNAPTNYKVVRTHTDFLPRKGELLAIGSLTGETPTKFYRVLDTVHVVDGDGITSELHAPTVILSSMPETPPWAENL